MSAPANRRAPPEIDRARKDATINVRVPIKTRDLIDSAAAAVGKTRTEFILESARQHAIDVLLDQRLVSLGEDEFEMFLDALDRPPLPSARLRDLFEQKSPWEA